MSNGIVHDDLSKKLVLLVPPILSISVLKFVGLNGALLALGASFIGAELQRIMTPDLDVDAGYYGFFLVKKISGGVGEQLWKLFWLPYRKIVPHRSLISHSPFISTIIRLVYLLIPVYIVSVILHGQLELLHFGYNNWDAILYFYLGMAILDLGHLTLDFIHPIRVIYEKMVPKSYLQISGKE